MSGVLTAGGMVLANIGSGEKDLLVEFADAHAITLVALVLAGFICGEARELSWRKSREWTENGKWLESESKRLRAESQLARQARHQIQERLAMWNAPLACLDDDLRRLIPMPETEVYEGLLRTLYSTCQVTSSAIFRRSGSELLPLASLHTSERFKSPMGLADLPMAVHAIETGELVTLDVAAAESGDAACLAVLPWDAHDTHGVLIIEDMPMSEFTWSVFERVELIVRWTFMLRELRLATAAELRSGGLLPQGDFLALLSRSLETARDHLLPSSSLTLRLADSKSTTFGELVKATSVAAPEICAMTAMPGDAGLVVLLPFAGDAAAEAMAQAVRHSIPDVRAARYTIAGAERPEVIWGRLLQG
ncbi:MAG: hypothetical protein KDK97_06330 [Verrucomicrobiales bacterium]|nr:hypothetical protein [Verrucomicrobiales bacterium]MCP5558153.1 hypothetical protein [Verrucomicrobiaceae bacterium]